MQKLLQIREEDAVAVALAPIAAGEIVSFGPGKTMTARESVRQGHKIAPAAHPGGNGRDQVRLFHRRGPPRILRRGQWVHTHNMKSRLTEHVEYAYEPDVRPLAPCEPETFMGYRREDGRAGIRNEIWIIPRRGLRGRLVHAPGRGEPGTGGALRLGRTLRLPPIPSGAASWARTTR